MDRNRQKGYAEPDQNDLQWQRGSQTGNEETVANRTEQEANSDDIESEDSQEGTVAVGSGLGIDE